MRYYPPFGPREIPSSVGKYIEEIFNKLVTGWRQEVGPNHDCLFEYPLMRFKKGVEVGLNDPWDGEFTFTAFPKGYMGGGSDGSISLHWSEWYKATSTHGEHGCGCGLVRHVKRVSRTRGSITIIGVDPILGQSESETFTFFDVKEEIQSTLDRWFA